MLRHALFCLCLAQPWTLLLGNLTGYLGPISADKFNQAYVLKDACTCVRDDGTEINLHHLDTAPKPRFKINSDDFIIEWNPCTGLKIDDDEDIAVAVGFVEGELFSFGYQKTAKFYRLNNMDMLSYNANDSVTQITLMCDENVSPTFVQDTETLTPLMARYHGPCKPKSFLSIGSVILITLLVIIIVYFAIGCVVNSFLRKKTGCERIPNQTFWCGLPSLIGDGCRYTFRRLKHKSSYEEI